MLIGFVTILLTAVVVFAQRYDRGRYRERPISDRSEFPRWENYPVYEEDVFTFARIRYTPHYRRGWDGDYPEADWNISYRLQQLTSLKVNPNPVVIFRWESVLSFTR